MLTTTLHPRNLLMPLLVLACTDPSEPTGSDATVLSNNLAPPGPTLPPPPSPTLRRIAFVSGRDGNAEIYTATGLGNDVVRLTSHPDFDWYPAWSPDGTRLAFVRHNLTSQIYVMNADGSALENVSDLSGQSWSDWSFAWSPDSKRLAFSRTLEGAADIYTMNADGSGKQKLTSVGKLTVGYNFCPAWAPDGQRIGYLDHSTLKVMQKDGTQARTLAEHVGNGCPVWSPDGKWLAFATTGDMRGQRAGEIYRIAPDGTGRTNVTNNLDWEHNPRWSPDGRLYFWAGDWLGVIGADGTGRQLLVHAEVHDREYSITSDGQRIAYVQGKTGAPSPGAQGATRDIFAVNPDGSHQDNVTDSDGGDYMPAWRP